MLGILAGQGDLPRRLIEACCQENKPFFILAFKNQTDPLLVQDFPHAWVELGHISKALEILHHEKVTQLVMGGAFKRPSLISLAMDGTALKWLGKIGTKAFGDDGLLSGIIQQLELEGFQILAPQDILTNLLAPDGVLGQHIPSADELKQIEKGIQILKDLAPHDIGQGLIIENHVILALEAIEGTDAMMERTAPFKREKNAGILIKMCKPNQSTQVDLPTIGPRTIETASRIGLRGIAIEAGKSNIIDLPSVIQLADRKGLFLYGFAAS